jgi:hypothetical protein
MIILKRQFLGMIGEGREALHAIQEVGNLESRSLSFPDLFGCRVDHVYSGVQLAGLASKQPPCGILKSGARLGAQ